MNLKNIGSRVQQAVQAAQTSAKKAGEDVKANLAKSQMTAQFRFGDEFVTYSAGGKGAWAENSTARLDVATAKGTGISQRFEGRQYGVHFRVQDGAATLGSVSVEARGREVVLGLVPAAPTPLPMIVYAGVDRDGEG